jgi:hypothetical protein
VLFGRSSSSIGGQQRDIQHFSNLMLNAARQYTNTVTSQQHTHTHTHT